MIPLACQALNICAHSIATSAARARYEMWTRVFNLDRPTATNQLLLALSLLLLLSALTLRVGLEVLCCAVWHQGSEVMLKVCNGVASAIWLMEQIQVVAQNVTI